MQFRRFGRCDEWHLDFQKSLPHIALGVRPWLSQKAIVFGTPFSQSGFISVGAIGDSVTGDRVEQVFVEEPADG